MHQDPISQQRYDPRCVDTLNPSKFNTSYTIHFLFYFLFLVFIYGFC